MYSCLYCQRRQAVPKDEGRGADNGGEDHDAAYGNINANYDMAIKTAEMAMRMATMAMAMAVAKAVVMALAMALAMPWPWP